MFLILDSFQFQFKVRVPACTEAGYTNRFRANILKQIALINLTAALTQKQTTHKYIHFLPEMLTTLVHDASHASKSI